MNAPSAHIQAMVDNVRGSSQPPVEQAEALVAIAFDFLKKPATAQPLLDALHLYGVAAELAKDNALARARALAGRASALRRLPGQGHEPILEARAALEEARPILAELGDKEELAEVEMTYGLVLQTLAGANLAPLADAIAAYHRALRFFTSDGYPREFAILHNNLATAYLSMRMAPDRAGLREALAVQSFREALKVVTLQEAPTEYAMLQSNLGNALQALRDGHPFENLTRAVEAYEEALKVRTRRDMPIEHANTLANKANALMNLPDDPENVDRGNPKNLASAASLFETAHAIFTESGLHERADVVSEILASVRADLP